MFAGRWERSQSMKTNNSISLLLDFQESGTSFLSWFCWRDSYLAQFLGSCEMISDHFMSFLVSGSRLGEKRRTVWKRTTVHHFCLNFKCQRGHFSIAWNRVGADLCTMTPKSYFGVNISLELHQAGHRERKRGKSAPEMLPKWFRKRRESIYSEPKAGKQSRSTAEATPSFLVPIFSQVLFTIKFCKQAIDMLKMSF